MQHIGIVGLGLIGGSLARAFSRHKDLTVYAYDRDTVTLDYARLAGVVNAPLDEQTLPACDFLLLALYPEASIAYLRQVAPKLSRHTVVIDCCGTKRKICECGFALAEQYGFSFVGGHPMAGSQYSGFKYSREDLLAGSSMILVPRDRNDIALLGRIKELMSRAGVARIVISEAADHDRMIAFTSQLAHVVSNAYVKSPRAQEHKGYSAGSYRDLTRVAWLNEAMWTELFFENGDYLADELDTIIESLTAYRDALAAGDHNRMRDLLREGRLAKERVDGTK